MSLGAINLVARGNVFYCRVFKPPTFYFAVNEHPATELGEDLDPRVGVVNRYFDATPLTLVTIAIGEDGPFDPRASEAGR